MTTPDRAQGADGAARAARHAPGAPPDGIERRKNPRLRELIDEMLATVRVAAKRDLWTPEERSQATRELEEIMGRIRSQAIDNAS